jgi:hypothetical protein
VQIGTEAERQARVCLGFPPLGYKKDPENPKKWIVDEEGAKIVRMIYRLRIEGMSTNGIAKELKTREILISSMYALEKGLRKPSVKNPKDKFMWNAGMIRSILLNRSYTGDVVNFKTYSKSFKLKERLKNSKENLKIHENMHEAIIERESWERIQKSFGLEKYRKPKYTEKNMFAGFLKCSDCGANLNYKFTRQNPDNHYFSCLNNRVSNGLCKKTHHIRVDNLEKIVKKEILKIMGFYIKFKDEFVKILISENFKQIQIRNKKHQDELEKLIARDKQLDVLLERIYEDKIFGKLSKERFGKLFEKYEFEHHEILKQTEKIEVLAIEENSHEKNSEKFILIVKKYLSFNFIDVLNSEILHDFIDKIVVHHRVQTGKPGEITQKTEIFFKYVGKINLPHMRKTEIENYLKVFGRTDPPNKLKKVKEKPKTFLNSFKF